MYVNLFVVEMKVKFKKFSPRARLPTLATPGSAWSAHRDVSL